MRATRQPRIPTSLVNAAETTMATLDVDHQTAATWVHAGALAQHAAQTGLAPAGLPTRAALDTIATRHESLEHWGKLAAAIPATAEHKIDALWLEHPLTDPADAPALWYSYPLGDLYQGLSTEAVKGRAFCQTPWWVGELLLHISYDRAIEHWDDPRVIDPSCGAGHLLVESYLAARSARTLAGRWNDPMACLNQVHGVDLDPHAAATAAYRLTTLAYAESWTGPQNNRRRTTDGLPDAPIHVAAANSLLAESEPLLGRGRYHVVVANPPYITVKDPEMNAAVRARYPETTHRRYSLALPFHQLMMKLLVPGGWCAQLTANSFAKREFGTKYVQNWLSHLDAQWIIDTSGAYIPGHGTPTVIMCHRNQLPTSDTVRVIQGIQGEPSAPAEPSEGLVWSAIRDQVYARESTERHQRRYEAETAAHLAPRAKTSEPTFELIAPPSQAQVLPGPKRPKQRKPKPAPKNQPELIHVEAA